VRPIWSPRANGHNPLSRFLWQRAWDAHIEQVKVEIARDTGQDLRPHSPGKIGDRRQLRGIPVAGAASGTIDDTQPEQTLIRREARRERDRERTDLT